jgi:hypothetical protein
LEKISLVEQHLRNHHDVVAQLCENQYHATDQGEELGFGGAQGPLPDQDVLAAGGTGNESASHRGSSSIIANIPYPSNVQTAQPIIEDLNDSIRPGDAILRDVMQRDSSGPGKDSGQEFRLHISDFIQTLSE